MSAHRTGTALTGFSATVVDFRDTAGTYANDLYQRPATV
jgi:hypothetical protein